MGFNSTHALGRQTKASVQNEVVFGAGPAVVSNLRWVPGDSVTALGAPTVETTQERKVRADARQSRSAIEIIRGVKSNSVTLRSYVLPPLVPGTNAVNPSSGLPDVAPLLKGFFGVETINAATVVYSLSNAQNVPPSVTALFEYNGVKSDLIKGWVIEEWRLSIPNGEEPTFEFTGPARQQILTGAATSTANASVSATSHTITLAITAESRLFEVGSIFTYGAVASPFEVTAVNHTTGVLTITNADDASVASIILVTDLLITPFSAYAEAVGINGIEPATLVSCVNGKIDLGADNDITFQSCEITGKQGNSEIRPGFTDLVSDFNPGYREITGTITFWVRGPDILKAMGNPRYIELAGVNGKSLDITLGGDTTGDGQLDIAIPIAHLDFASADLPDGEAGTVQVPFTCLATDLTAEDEITLTYSLTP
ncbi:MAG: hypothetical protein JKY94_16780 [Rhodobacteraceae bacterium]|nr:hypothetical protein [Paracoccaceae bacterium]